MSDQEQQPEAVEAQPTAQGDESTPAHQEASRPLTADEWMAAHGRPHYVKRPGFRVEIRLAVDNLKETEAFFKKLGFRPCDISVYTDGQIVIHLVEDDIPSPRLDYRGAWLEFLVTRGVIPKRVFEFASFVDPSGAQLSISTVRHDMPIPRRLYERVPNPHLGTFGQYMLPCEDFETSVAFWQSFTFHLVHASTDPYPWGILTDKLFIIGLHQNPEITEPHLTYYAPDMEAKIQQLQQDGIPVTPVPPLEDGRVRNGLLVAPGGQKILLLEGEVNIGGWVNEANRLLKEILEREQGSPAGESNAEDTGEASDSGPAEAESD